MTIKVIDRTWVTSGMHTIGIVVTENEVGERRLRSAVCIGKDEEKDVKYIRDWGGTVTINDLERMIKLVKESEKKS